MIAAILIATVPMTGTPLSVLPPEPAISAPSAIIMDEQSGVVLYAKDAHASRHPASTTKIMTALLLLEKCKLDEMITAPHDIKTIGEASIYLEPFEQIAAKDALYSLLVKSANDVSHAVACHIGGTVEGFATMMNERAAKLGCKGTRFTNPHGLSDDAHMTTAYDLALMAREAMNWPEFRTASRTKRVLIERSSNQLNRLLISKNRFLDSPNADGIKTGWTDAAGKCFVGAKSVNGWRLITVVLKSDDWLTDTNALFDWAYTKFQRTEVIASGQRVAVREVSRGVTETVLACAGEGLYVITERGKRRPRTSLQFKSLEAPVQRGEIIGGATIITYGRSIVAIPLVAADSVERSNSILSISGFSPLARTVFWVLVLGAGALIVVRRLVRTAPPRKRRNA